MKMSALRIILPFCCAITLIFCFLTGCDNVECQAPPPLFYFQVASDDSIYPNPADTSAKITISYVDNGKAKSITDLNGNGDFYSSHEIIERSWALNNPVFTIALDSQELTKIKFDTYINKGKCQGWPSISNVYENGQLIQKTENLFFELGHK